MRDSIILSHLRAAAIRTPELRQATFSAEAFGKTDFKSEYLGEKHADGKLAMARTFANVNVPVIAVGKNMISSSFSIMTQYMQIEDSKSFIPSLPVRDMSFNKNTLGFRLGITRLDSLFGKPVVYSLGATGITDEEFGITRMNYMGLLSFGLKRTPKTAVSLGVVAIIDPSSPIPAFVYVSYWHKFSNNIELIANLPTKLALSKQYGKANISFGTDMGGTTAFFYPQQPGLPDKSLYSTFELRTGPGIEYLINKSLIIGLKGGLMNTLNARLFDKNEKPTDYVIKNKVGAVPYVNVSISLLPIFKSL